VLLQKGSGDGEPSAPEPGDHCETSARSEVLVLPGRVPLLRKGGDHCFAYQGENQFHCILGSGGHLLHHSSF